MDGKQCLLLKKSPRHEHKKRMNGTGGVVEQKVQPLKGICDRSVSSEWLSVMGAGSYFSEAKKKKM